MLEAVIIYKNGKRQIIEGGEYLKILEIKCKDFIGDDNVEQIIVRETHSIGFLKQPTNSNI